MYIEKNEHDYQAAVEDKKQAYKAKNQAVRRERDMKDPQHRAEYTQEVTKAKVELRIYSEMVLQIEAKSDFSKKYIDNKVVKKLQREIV